MRFGLLFIAFSILSSSAFAVSTVIDPAMLVDSETIYVNVDKSGDEANSQTAAIYRAKTVYGKEVRELIAVVPVVTGKGDCSTSPKNRCFSTPDMREVNPIRMHLKYQSGLYENLRVKFAMFIYKGWFAAAARTDLPIRDYNLDRFTSVGVQAHKIGVTHGVSGGAIYFLEEDIEQLFNYAKECGEEKLVFTVLSGINREVLPRIK